MSDQRILTPEEVAKRLGVSVYTLQKWRERKPDFPTPVFYKYGKSVRYLLSDIEKYEAECRREANA